MSVVDFYVPDDNRETWHCRDKTAKMSEGEFFSHVYWGFINDSRTEYLKRNIVCDNISKRLLSKIKRCRVDAIGNKWNHYVYHTIIEHDCVFEFRNCGNRFFYSNGKEYLVVEPDCKCYKITRERYLIDFLGFNLYTSWDNILKVKFKSQKLKKLGGEKFNVLKGESETFFHSGMWDCMLFYDNEDNIKQFNFAYHVATAVTPIDWRAQYSTPTYGGLFEHKFSEINNENMEICAPLSLGVFCRENNIELPNSACIKFDFIMRENAGLQNYFRK